MNGTLKQSMVCAALGLALCGTALAQNAQPAMGDAATQLHKVMEDSHQKSMQMKMSGDADHDFAMMMRNHHAAGIAMAEVELDKGKDAQMKKMAQKIIDAQKKEIKQFDDWMAKHKK